MINVTCQEGLYKQARPRSDCFWRSHLIRVFPVCYSDKQFVNHALININFFENRKRSVWNFRIFTVCSHYQHYYYRQNHWIIIDQSTFCLFSSRCPGWSKVTVVFPGHTHILSEIIYSMVSKLSPFRKSFRDQWYQKIYFSKSFIDKWYFYASCIDGQGHIVFVPCKRDTPPAKLLPKPQTLAKERKKNGVWSKKLGLSKGFQVLR